MSDKENNIIKDKHIFICLDGQFISLNTSYQHELEYIKSHFCGKVYTNLENITYFPDSIIYLCGDIGYTYDKIPKDHVVCVIRELSSGIYLNENYRVIGIGEVPINIHNVGVYFRNLFPDDKNYFNLIKSAHEFQTLTESNKAGTAFRTGIYLTNVTSDDAHDVHFNLLRCSTNLSGPTDNFREVDHRILNKVNNMCKVMFETPIELNHVLAQIYENSVDHKKKEKKAVIKAHSDKTKDMPKNALIAFTTFYDRIVTKDNANVFDVRYGNTSVLTRLYFRLKNTVRDSTLVKEFSVTLYPNSCFIIPLSTNRLYTHETKPSILPVDKIPTRLGYVIRCSNTKAVFKENQTYINKSGELIKMNDATPDDVRKLKELYLEENLTPGMINYNDIYFSLNSGDYKMPIV